MNAVVNTKLITRTFTTTDQTTKAIIAIHGWTGDEYVFEPVAKRMKIQNVKWFFPRAPYEADTGKGFSWFSGSDEKGWDIQKTWDGMQQLMADVQSEGFLPGDIFLMGFSQGACLSMEFALRLPFTLGGIIPIAGFIKFVDILKTEATQQSKKTPVLLLHGTQDEIIPFSASEKAFAFLKQLGHSVMLESYNATHKISMNTVPTIQNFISDSLNFVKLNAIE